MSATTGAFHDPQSTRSQHPTHRRVYPATLTPRDARCSTHTCTVTVEAGFDSDDDESTPVIDDGYVELR